MQFVKESKNLFIGLLAGFMIIALIATYWSIMGANTILQRDDNARLFNAEASIIRGSIYDRNNNLLVESQITADDTIMRTYHYPAFYSTLGYFSLRYGVGGAESAFDNYLSGNNRPQSFDTYFQQDILHQPQEGSDIRLTVDLHTQQTIYQAMDGLTGAVVVLSVPDGEVLGMISQPDIDPNELDENWENLIEEETRPFFNRALQGNYQPGGILYLALIATALSNNYDLNQSIEDANQEVELEDITLNCLLTPDRDLLTLSEAFLWGCPYPFVVMAGDIGLNRVESVFNRFLFTPQSDLQRFVNNVQPENTPEATTEPSLLASQEFTIEDVLGQGEITITPLNMAMITSAIINNGNAPVPTVQLGFRQLGEEAWTDIPNTSQTIPIMTSSSATVLFDLMAQLQSPEISYSSSIIYGGYSAIAFSGDQINTWFIGFIKLPDGSGFAVSVLLEDVNDIQQAQAIGSLVLTESLNSTITPNED